ncbi:ATPase [Priestia megaterium]|uniref:ATPase n=1 Tax=Priestia megaterium TaxID=1404 RepID=UPI000BFD364C|nr:ATPase [Priestia megaterium]PGQ88220.1 ATPase [Priestia megaterium]
MREIQNILTVTEDAISDFNSSLADLDRLEAELQKNEKELKELEELLELYEEVRLVLQELAETTREQISSELEHVVTLCLQAVFGEELSFEIEIDTSRNNTVVEFYVVDTSGDEILRQPPEDSMGGGIVDTCAIGLRFGLLQILNPKPKGPIILDEPAKMVSGGRIIAIASLFQELTDMFKKQAIFVTHHTPIMDVVENPIYFEKVNGYTRIETNHAS